MGVPGTCKGYLCSNLWFLRCSWEPGCIVALAPVRGTWWPCGQPPGRAPAIGEVRLRWNPMACACLGTGKYVCWNRSWIEFLDQCTFRSWSSLPTANTYIRTYIHTYTYIYIHTNIIAVARWVYKCQPRFQIWSISQTFQWNTSSTEVMKRHMRASLAIYRYHQNHHRHNNTDNNFNNNTWGCKFSRAPSIVRSSFYSSYPKRWPPGSDSHTSDVLSHSSHSVRRTWFSSPSSAFYFGSLHFASNFHFVRTLDFTCPPHFFPSCIYI